MQHLSNGLLEKQRNLACIWKDWNIPFCLADIISLNSDVIDSESGSSTDGYFLFSYERESTYS